MQSFLVDDHDCSAIQRQITLAELEFLVDFISSAFDIGITEDREVPKGNITERQKSSLMREFGLTKIGGLSIDSPQVGYRTLAREI